MKWIAEEDVRGLSDKKLPGDSHHEAFWQQFIMRGNSLEDKIGS